MSLRAKLVSLGLRLLVKRRTHADTPLAVVRGRLRLMSRLVPPPPRGTKTIAVDAGGVPAQRIATPQSRDDRHILYLHGGGYFAGSPPLYRDFSWRIAAAARANVLWVDYRLAPEHPFPAALDDVVSAWRWLLAEGADPRRAAFMGDSSGGGLALAALLRLRDEGLPLPAAAVVLSPWTDLALTGETLQSMAAADPMIPVEGMPVVVDLYLAGADPRAPYASPLYGNATGLPPTLILAGSEEVLRDDAVRMAATMRAAGCAVEIEIWPGMFHAWPLFARIMPEARAALARTGSFLDGRL
jgi:acetyl esterase/lipase